MTQAITNDEIKSWVSIKTGNYTSALAKSCLAMDGSEDDNIKRTLNWGTNGVGDRFGRQLFNYTVIYKNGTRYSEDIDDTIDDNILQTFVNETKNVRSGIIGLFIHSLKGKSTSRPIRKDIGIEVRKRFTIKLC